MHRLADGGYLLCGEIDSVTITFALVIKVDESGQVEWRHVFGEENVGYLDDGYSRASDLIELTPGNYKIVGALPTSFLGFDIGFISTWDTEGNMIDLIKEGTFYNKIVKGSDGDYYLLDRDISRVKISRKSNNGQTDWDIFYTELSFLGISPTDFIENSNKELVIVSVEEDLFGNDEIRLRSINLLGRVVWYKEYGGNGVDSPQSVIQTTDGGYLIGGSSNSFGNSSDHYLIKTDEEGVSFSGLIKGNVFNDLNGNCAYDLNEVGLEDWVVLIDGASTKYKITDEFGNYETPASPGSHIISIIPKNLFWEPCVNQFTVDVVNPMDTIDVDFSIQAAVDCPLMEVDISSPGLRRCFESFYYVKYCNYGTIDAEAAYIDITIDPFQSLVEATLPYIDLGNNVFRFEIDDVPINFCDQFRMTVLVDCDSTVLGQTHCTEAYIYPDSLCMPASGSWSGASLSVTGDCDGENVIFETTNNGDDMLQSSDYIIIEDHVMVQQENFLLNSGESIEHVLVANGSTFSMKVQQVLNHPGNSMPIAVVEGCVQNPDSSFSIGFVGICPEDDGNPFISIDCQPNIGSFDPNDKIGYPLGFNEEHFISPNTDIEYKIRFQNTGTDTAFTVVIKDNLDPFLDITSIRPGAASHPYNLDIVGDRTLEFTFDNIMLPDSNVNELASHGFVKFRISQQVDNPIGTFIRNAASIFFDFNDPVVTNTTFHTIGENFITTDVKEIHQSLTKVKIYPNPFNEYTTFELEGEFSKEMQFDLIDVNGRLVRRENHRGNRFTFYRKDLALGIYFYQIKMDGALLSKGKMMIH